MRSPIVIRYPDKLCENLIISNEWPSDCRYKIPFAIPSLTRCELGTFLTQYVNGEDYWMELWTFTVINDGYVDLIINSPSILITLFLKGGFSGQLSGNGFVHCSAKTWNIFYLPAGLQPVNLPKGEYVVLFIVPPHYYLQSMAIEHSGMKDIFNRLLTASSEGSLLTSFSLPHGAWKIIKRLEKTTKKGAALDIDLRRYILELLGLYNEQFKRNGLQIKHYNTTREKAIAVKNYILSHLGDGSLGGLNELALRFHVTQKPLTREFKLLTGRTIPQFITDERLQWAKELLSQNEMRVFEVTLIVGFSDTANFIRKFKRKYGYSPGKQKGFQ